MIPFGEKIEEFCKPQSNKVRARFDLLTNFWQGNESVDEWYNAVQTQVVLAKYPQETAKILHRDIFWFFLKDEEFVSKTINDSNIDLDKFPTSKVRQLAKKMESSKATARHIKHVASDPQVAQIILMMHQQTDLPASNHKKKKKSFVKLRPPSYKNDTSDRQSNYKKGFDAKNVYKNKERCQKCGDSLHIEGFQCPAKKFQCKSCHRYGHFTVYVTRKNKLHSSQGNQRSICCKQELCMLVTNPYVATQKIVHPVMSHSVCKRRYSNHKLNVTRFPYTLT